jgi:signal transduction histidine kinase
MATSHGSGAWDGRRVQLERLGLAAAVIDGEGRLVGATRDGQRVLRRVGVVIEALPQPLPGELVSLLRSAPLGEPLEWNAPGVSEDVCLGCTGYSLGAGHVFLVMRELSRQHRELSRRLHRQRLEITGRLVASIVHDLRAPLASMVFNAEALSGRVADMDAHQVEEVVEDLALAARRLRSTVDNLLGFARLGPQTRLRAPIEEVFERISGLVRPIFRTRGHVLTVSRHPDVGAVAASPLVVEQILVNLALNASEAAEAPITVSMEAEPVPGTQGAQTRIGVCDDGPGVPDDVRPHVFQPFFTTKQTGTGLGLTTAREAARDLGGDLRLEPPDDGRGACFVLELPSAEADGEEERS